MPGYSPPADKAGAERVCCALLVQAPQRRHATHGLVVTVCVPAARCAPHSPAHFQAFGRASTVTSHLGRLPSVGRQARLRGGGYKYEAAPSRGVFHTAMKGTRVSAFVCAAPVCWGLVCRYGLVVSSVHLRFPLLPTLSPLFTVICLSLSLPLSLPLSLSPSCRESRL